MASLFPVVLSAYPWPLSHWGPLSCPVALRMPASLPCLPSPKVQYHLPPFPQTAKEQRMVREEEGETIMVAELKVGYVKRN